MAINLFKTNWKIYKSWCVFTWELKKTKKECREAYKKDWCHQTRPAKITPKVIAETYDGIKQFLKDCFEPTETNNREGWYWVIITSSDMADYTMHARCYIRVYNNRDETQYDSRDYMWYNQRRRLCLAFFDNIIPKDESSKLNYIDAVDSDMYYKEQEVTHEQPQEIDDELLPF